MDPKFIKKFVIVWAVNSLLLVVANNLFPQGLELGNASLSTTMAAVFSGFLLTVFTRLVKPAAGLLKLSDKGRYPMFIFYWAANSVGIWLIARMAGLSGFGIAKFTWAVGLGFFATLTQWGVRQALKKSFKK
jgi:uncharacterized membrane protein YvlD (DUF360 family)